jgi:hypothetical protein
MFYRASFRWTILFILFFQIPYAFPGEIYCWKDDRGTTHFTDDISKIPEQYTDRAEKLKVREEKLEEVEKNEKREERSDRVKDYLENIEKKIEMKKSMERKISELEEELRFSEERLKLIEEYERGDYFYYMPFRDPKTGRWVPVASPYYEEKRRLKAKINDLKAEVERIQQRLSQLMRSI